MGQLQAFLLCAACGVLSGLLYDVLFVLTYPFKKRPVKIAADVLFCVLFAGVYLIFSTALELPPLRVYLLLGLALGFFLYLKSLHKIVAFLAKKVYNSYIKTRKKAQKKERRTWKGRKSRKKKRVALQ